MGYDVFLSYSREDRDAVVRLQERLAAAGLTVWRDEREITSFDDIQATLRTGLATSKTLLAYYSRHYPTSRYCQWELTAALLPKEEGRLLVVNPEDKVAHIHPGFLCGQLLPAPDTADLVEQVCRRVAAVDGFIPLAPEPDAVSWLGLT